MRVLISETTWASSAIAHDLAGQGFLLNRANDGEEALLYVRDAVQDAAVIDADLGDITAGRAIRSLRVFRPNLPVFAIAEGAGRETCRALFAAGADHVATALSEPAEVAARLRALARRAAGYTSPLATLGQVAVNFDTRRVSVGGIPLALTPAEYEIVEHLTLRRRRIVSRDQMMTHLYGLEDAPDPKLLDVHTTRIRKKLAAAGADPRQLRALHGRGFTFDGMRAEPVAA